MSQTHDYLPAEVQDDDRWFTLGKAGSILYCLQICCTCGLPHRIEINPKTEQIRFLDVPDDVKQFASEEYARHTPGKTVTFIDGSGGDIRGSESVASPATAPTATDLCPTCCGKIYVVTREDEDGRVLFTDECPSCAKGKP
jgi:hypothetical protein